MTLDEAKAEDAKRMKLIIHAPPYMCGRAADLAAHWLSREDTQNAREFGFVSGVHHFTVRRNKASASVWHFHAPTEEEEF